MHAHTFTDTDKRPPQVLFSLRMLTYFSYVWLPTSVFLGVCVFRVQPAVLNAQTGEEVTGNDVEGVLAFKRPWPSLARTVYGDHKRYMDVYLNPYKVRVFLMCVCVDAFFLDVYVVPFRLDVGSVYRDVDQVGIGIGVLGVKVVVVLIFLVMGLLNQPT